MPESHGKNVDSDILMLEYAKFKPVDLEGRPTAKVTAKIYKYKITRLGGIRKFFDLRDLTTILWKKIPFIAARKKLLFTMSYSYKTDSKLITFLVPPDSEYSSTDIKEELEQKLTNLATVKDVSENPTEKKEISLLDDTYQRIWSYLIRKGITNRSIENNFIPFYTRERFLAKGFVEYYIEEKKKRYKINANRQLLISFFSGDFSNKSNQKLVMIAGVSINPTRLVFQKNNLFMLSILTPKRKFFAIESLEEIINKQEKRKPEDILEFIDSKYYVSQVNDFYITGWPNATKKIIKIIPYDSVDQETQTELKEALEAEVSIFPEIKKNIIKDSKWVIKFYPYHRKYYSEYIESTTTHTYARLLRPAITPANVNDVVTRDQYPFMSLTTNDRFSLILEVFNQKDNQDLVIAEFSNLRFVFDGLLKYFPSEIEFENISDEGNIKKLPKLIGLDFGKRVYSIYPHNGGVTNDRH